MGVTCTHTEFPADPHACGQAWTALNAAHARVAERLSSALSRACGLTVNDFEILLRLDKAPPPGVRLGDLLPAVRLTQPSLSRMVARLVQQGWLARSEDPDDGRSVLVTLTPAGREVLLSALPVHAQAIHDSLLARLTSAEQDLLNAALSRIIKD